MSYINVEAGNLHHRVILGNHLIPTPASQLQDGCTGIVIEGAVNIPNTMYEALAGASRLARTPFVAQFSALREEAKGRLIPIVAGEPLASPRAASPEFDEGGSPNFSSLLSRLLRGSVDDMLLLSTTVSEEEIRRDSPEFLNVSAAIARYRQKHPNVLIIPKNMLIAERTLAFAEFQLRSGIANPSLAVVVGSLHLGTVEGLESPMQTRLENINGEPRTRQYYQGGRLGDIFYVEYNAARKGRWINKVVVDTELKKS